jgi:hypothetical protein
MNIVTPWGRPDTIQNVADGLLIVSTPSHGGILVSAERLASMSDYMRKPLYAGQFACYEEDCEWPMPVLVFETNFRAFYERESTEKAEDIIPIAANILKNWHPATYERFYDTKLAPGESFKRDEDTFYAANKGSWLVVAARGNWSEDPDAMVQVQARLGGIANKDYAKDRCFLVPTQEYSRRPEDDLTGRFHAFKIDPERHREVPTPQQHYQPETL